MCFCTSLRSETDHELRAALICLLTAALAAKGTTAIIREAGRGGSGYRRIHCGNLGRHKDIRVPAKTVALNRSGPSVPRLLSAAHSSFRGRRLPFSLDGFKAKVIRSERDQSRHGKRIRSPHFPPCDSSCPVMLGAYPALFVD
jgi:hypothetical protein